MGAEASIQLLVGLGNPGQRYEGTRHNAGFWFGDALARANSQQFRLEQKFQAEYCRVRVGAGEVSLLKPQTFMNCSGQPLQKAGAYYKIPLERTLVVHDEIDLPPGTVRLKFGGGHGGHNGLRDIFAHAGRDFWRLRMGVGHPGNKDDVINFVLQDPRKEEQGLIDEAMNRALKVVPLLVEGEFERAMHELHTEPKVKNEA